MLWVIFCLSIIVRLEKESDQEMDLTALCVVTNSNQNLRCGHSAISFTYPISNTVKDVDDL